MGATCSSETSVDFQRTVRLYIPEGIRQVSFITSAGICPEVKGPLMLSIPKTLPLFLYFRGNLRYIPKLQHLFNELSSSLRLLELE
jgi:hypothetical protein